MADTYLSVVLPAGELKIEDKEIIIANCQISASTPENALKAAFIVNKVEESLFEVSNENINNDEELKTCAEQLGLSAEEMLRSITATLETEKQINDALSIRITNQSVENAKAIFKVDRSRLICVEENQEILCQGYVSVTKKPNGILLKGSSTAIKNFSIGETIQVGEGDSISINDQVVVEFKRMVAEEKWDDVSSSPRFFGEWQ